MFSFVKRANTWLEAINTGVVQLLQGQNRNTHILTQILQNTEQIMADQGAMQAAVSSLQNDIPTLIAAYQAALVRESNNTGVDNSAQIAELTTLDQNIKDALSNASAAAAAPVVSQPSGEPATTPTATTSGTDTGTAAGDTSTGTASTGSIASATSTSEPVAETSPSASEEEHATEENTNPHS